MSPPQHPTSINLTCLKIRLAYRFLHALKNLNDTTNVPLNAAKRSTSEDNQIRRRSHLVKTAAYTSMASVVGSRRAWSRAILWKIRNRGVLARNKTRVYHKTTRRCRRLHRHPQPHAVSTRRRNPNPNPKREYVDQFGSLGLEEKLRKLVPGAKTMDACGLLDETADYIKCLATQVEVMRTIVDLYSTT